MQEFGAVLPPIVLAPGTVVGKVTSQAAKSFGLSRECLVVAGTTGESTIRIPAPSTDRLAGSEVMDQENVLFQLDSFD